MAGDWIKMRGNLWDDPRVAQLCELTEQGEAAVIGALYWLWATADQHTEDGFMPGLTVRQIDRKTGVSGFGQALLVVGWLVDSDGGVTIAKFDDHNGASAKRRCTDAQRKANVRKVSASDADKPPTDDGRVVELLRQIAELEKEKEKNKQKDPEANASDAAASSLKHQDPKAELLRESIIVLTAGGCPESLCRSFMGKLVKDYGEPTVREAVTAGISAQPADAREYLKATCQRLKGERRDPITVPCTDTRADAFKAEMTERAATATKPPASLVALVRRPQGEAA